MKFNHPKYVPTVGARVKVVLDGWNDIPGTVVKVLCRSVRVHYDVFQFPMSSWSGIDMPFSRVRPLTEEPCGRHSTLSS